VALDTAGVAKDYLEVLKLVDLVILDVKAVDSREYEFITGRKIDDFIEFVEKCQSLDKKLWLRQVIVPGINDDEEHVLKLKEFASKLKNVERVELLPYHSMAKSKYEKLGLKYELDGVSDMDKAKLQELQALL
ncbi:MAG: pyruvate formate-lyase 1-activating enzyme, partial [Clostridia bacterium]|nr:pyruvate formate-lyase 1-activating enzyme [Clostridia bacterium]